MADAVIFYLQNPVFDQPFQNRFGQDLHMSTGDFFGERLILWPRASDIKIRRNADAGAEGRQFLRGFLAGVGLARGDVDLGTVFHQPLRDHVADAAGAAGDQRHFVLDGKNTVDE